jgi:hypothetical protein
VGGLEQLRLLYRPKISRPRGVFDVVAGERLTGVLHGKYLRSQPQGNLSIRQSFLGVDLPVPDAGVPRSVQDAHEPGREERPFLIPILSRIQTERVPSGPDTGPQIAPSWRRWLIARAIFYPFLTLLVFVFAIQKSAWWPWKIEVLDLQVFCAQKFPPDQSLLGLIPLNSPGHVLHAISGGAALYLGLARLRD